MLKIYKGFYETKHAEHKMQGILFIEYVISHAFLGVKNVVETQSTMQ